MHGKPGQSGSVHTKCVLLEKSIFKLDYEKILHSDGKLLAFPEKIAYNDGKCKEVDHSPWMLETVALTLTEAIPFCSNIDVRHDLYGGNSV